MPIEAESPEQLGYDSITNNLSESSYKDASLSDLGEILPDLHQLILCYGDHAGHEGLRKLLAGTTALAGKEDVLLTTGAAGALFMLATALLEKGDELVVVRPNYATNIETPRAIGAQIHFVDLRFENGFRLDTEAVAALVHPGTRYISVTHPHNPTGTCLTDAEMKALVRIAEENNVWLLVDETYRDMVFGEKLPPATDYSPKVISVSSLSKTYGLPGIRLGWLICRDPALMATLLAAREQIQICGSVLDEEVAFRYLQQKDRYFPAIQKDIRENFELVRDWMHREARLEWVEPQGGCVCFPRMRFPEKTDLDRFYQILLQDYGTYTGPGHWFEMPRHYMRIGFGWPGRQQLIAGLEAISSSLTAAERKG